RLAAPRRAEQREELSRPDRERDAVERRRRAVALDEVANLDGGVGGCAQRSSLFHFSVHCDRCFATWDQSKSTSFSTSAGPWMSFFATSAGTFTVWLVGLKKSSVANASWTSGERYASISFQASSLFFEPFVTWTTWSRIGVPSLGATQSTGMPRFCRS